MKILLLLGVAALVVGGIFHAELGRFIADLAGGPSGGGSAVGSSIQGMGSSGKSLMEGVGNAFGN